VQTLLTRKDYRVFYSCVAVALFFVGWLGIPKTLVSMKAPYLKESFSFFSGLSLSSWWLSGAMLVDWWRSGTSKIFGNKTLVILTLILIPTTVIWYPPIISSLMSWNDYLAFRPIIIIGYACLTALASLLVYVLGLNASSHPDSGEREGRIRFLLSLITFVSLVSVATSFALGSARLESSYQRAIVVSAYFILPLATYSLGYLARLMKLPIAQGLTLSLSLIFGFTIGGSALYVMEPNTFFYSAGITLFLLIGVFLALFEQSEGLFGTGAREWGKHAQQGTAYRDD
jgi:hypothetical protein